MPLHLLGKKSWNVYNADNIARVRRDEAAAKAEEEAEEQRMQEVDAERRLAILRGEVPPPLPPAEIAESAAEPGRTRDGGDAFRGREWKKRKRAGEDDTDFELRIARERSDVVQSANETLRKSTSSAPIVDRAGHIDLFGEDRKQGRHLKNEEAENEAAKKKKEFEDQYTMRFSNAAGRDGLVGPWYANSGSRAELSELEPPSKDVWGNEDPRRKQREAERIVASDPLAMMKRGAAKVRELKKERQRFEAERQRELEQLRKDEKHRETRERRKREHRRDSGRHEHNRDRDDRGRRDRDRRDDERYDRGSKNEISRDDARQSRGDKHDERVKSHRSDRSRDRGRDRGRERSQDGKSCHRERRRHDRDSTSRRLHGDRRHEKRGETYDD